MVMFPTPVDIPPMPEGHAADLGFRLDGINGRRLRQPIEKRLPHSLRLLRVQSEMNHADLELVVRREVCLFTPMMVEESFTVESEKLADQPSITVVRRSLDSEIGAAGKFGKIAHA